MKFNRKKSYVGLEIISSELKLAVCENDIIKKIVLERIPNNLVDNDIVLDWNQLGNFIKETMKKHSITCKRVALVLPEEIAYVRRLLMPYMTIPQLKFNLPFEFHDFTGDEKDKYVYDYAVMDILEEEENGTTTKKLDLLAVVIAKETIDNYIVMLKKAGLSLEIAAPEACAYQNIIKKYLEKTKPETAGDYAILDIRKGNANLRIFTNGKYESSREMEFNLQRVVDMIKEKFQVSNDVALQYLDEGKEEVVYSEEAMSVYSQISLEVMRIINFFLYNHPNNTLDTLYCCGMGGKIDPLRSMLEETVGLRVKELHELFDAQTEQEKMITVGAATVGITWN